MTGHEAKEILEGIKSYEKTLVDLIENHSVSVQDACTIGINAIDQVDEYNQAIEDIKRHILNRIEDLRSLTAFDTTEARRAYSTALEIIDTYLRRKGRANENNCR